MAKDSQAEIEKLRKKLELKEKEVALLYQLDSIRDSTENAELLFEEYTKLIKDVFDVEIAFGLRYSHALKKLRLLSYTKAAGRVFGSKLEKFALDFGEKALRKKEVWIIRNFSKAASRYASAKKLKNMLCVPLFLNGVPLGVFLLVNKKDKDFDDEDLHILNAFVSQTDSAIDHARLFNMVQHRNKELELLYKIDEIRDNIKDFDEMLNMVLEEIVEAIDANIGFIMLYSERREQLELKIINIGPNSQFVKNNKKVLEKVSVQTIKKEVIQNLTKVNKDISSILTIPLVLSDRIIGVFGVVNSRHEFFTELDERFLRAIGSQVDTAIFEDMEKRKIKDVFKRYVAEEVVEEMLKKEKDYLSGNKMHMSVSFADLRGFTSMSEKMEPEDLVITINDYLGAMTEIVMKNKATLDKFVGDEVMALFGAPVHYKDHAVRAIKTAVEMQKAMKTLHKKWKKEGKKVCDLGIGVNTGWMVAGNIGCEKMTDYTVLGDAVNLGARLCSAAKGGQILLSEATYKQAKGKFKFKKLEPITVKGKAKPINIYEVVY